MCLFVLYVLWAEMPTHVVGSFNYYINYYYYITLTVKFDNSLYILDIIVLYKMIIWNLRFIKFIILMIK